MTTAPKTHTSKMAWACSPLGRSSDERQADERDDAVEDAADEHLVAAAQDRRRLVEDDARASPGRT